MADERHDGGVDHQHHVSSSPLSSRQAPRRSADDDTSDLRDQLQPHMSEPDDQQPLLQETATDTTAPTVQARIDVNGVTYILPTTDVVGARLLNALPQFSQWLQNANSSTLLRNDSLRRQSSGAGRFAGSGVGDETSSPVARDEDNDGNNDSSLGTLSDQPDGTGMWSDSPPRSRRRGASYPRTSPLPAHVARRGLNASLLDIMAESGRDVRMGVDSSTQDEHEHHEDSPADDADISGIQSPATAAVRDANANNAVAGEEQSAMDELQTLFRRCHHSLPFIGLFIIYFAYQHTTGIIVFFVGTVAIIGLDQRMRSQIALKEKASALHLVAIMIMCAIDMFALCCIDGDPNPLRHFAKIVHGDHPDRVFWDVIWTVIVNDFIIRLCSVSVKAVVALIKSNDQGSCSCGKRNARTARGAAVPGTQHQQSASADSPYVDAPDLESQPFDSSTAASPRASSSVAFYRRKLCASKFIADVFTFAYIFTKVRRKSLTNNRALILGTQGRKIFALVRSFITLGLEYGVYVSHEDLVEAGNPDCSICYEPMHLPVKLSCSHMFCEECVMEWFDRERSCPLCRASVATSLREQDEVKPQFLDGSTSLFPQLF
ncbi:Ring finger and transmembrane domain-containing protein 2, partial [Globisporangium splendens]